MFFQERPPWETAICRALVSTDSVPASAVNLVSSPTNFILRSSTRFVTSLLSRSFLIATGPRSVPIFGVWNLWLTPIIRIFIGACESFGAGSLTTHIVVRRQRSTSRLPRREELRQYRIRLFLFERRHIGLWPRILR